MSWLEAVARLAAAAVYLYVALTVAWRAGYRGGWVYAFVLIPGLNVVGLAILTFREWPVERELREARDHQPAAASGYPPLP